MKKLQTPHRSLQIAKIWAHLWSHMNHINPSSFSTRALVYCGILKFPGVFQKVFVLGKREFTWVQGQCSSTQSACHCTAQSATVKTSSLQGSEDILRNLPVFPTSAAIQQILHLIWQTTLSHLGDKYGKDILSFWQALRSYVPIFFVKASSIVINVSQYHIFKMYHCILINQAACYSYPKAWTSDFISSQYRAVLLCHCLSL